MTGLAGLFNQISNAAFALLCIPGRLLGERGELLWVALALGAGMGLVFRWLVDRPRLEAARARLRAALLELWLFRHDPWVVLRAEGELMAANAGYLRAFFVPLAAAMLVAAPLLIQIYSRWGLQPAAPGKALLLTAQLEPGSDWGVDLEWVRGQGTILPPVREPARNRLVWRIEPAVQGPLVLRLHSSSDSADFPLCVGQARQGIGALRAKSGIRQLFHPRAYGLEAGSAFSSIQAGYPRSAPQWLIWLSGVSLVAAWVVNSLVETLWPRKV